MPSLRPTIRDVAAHAGVSYQTVSRVINGEPGVAPATRTRVEKAIAELGYQPNAIARSMATGSTRTLICLSPNLTDYTFACIIEGAQTEARKRGYALFSASAADEELFAELVQQMVGSRRVDGLMVINPYADGRHAYVPAAVPTVFVGARPREGDVHSVALDDVEVGRMATAHLIERGHRRIAMITGPLAEDCSQDRVLGYKLALSQADIPFDPALQCEGDWSASSAYAACRRLIAGSEPPTAVFAQNDRMAIGVIRAVRDVGLRVPADLAVIGVDDMPLASYFDPPLTTVRQDLFAIGEQAARLLLLALHEPAAPPQHLRIPAQLVIRAST